MGDRRQSHRIPGMDANTMNVLATTGFTVPGQLNNIEGRPMSPMGQVTANFEVHPNVRMSPDSVIHGGALVFSRRGDPDKYVFANLADGMQEEGEKLLQDPNAHFIIWGPSLNNADSMFASDKLIPVVLDGSKWLGNIGKTTFQPGDIVGVKWPPASLAERITLWNDLQMVRPSITPANAIVPELVKVDENFYMEAFERVERAMLRLLGEARNDEVARAQLLNLSGVTNADPYAQDKLNSSSYYDDRNTRGGGGGGGGGGGMPLHVDERIGREFIRQAGIDFVNVLDVAFSLGLAIPPHSEITYEERDKLEAALIDNPSGDPVKAMEKALFDSPPDSTEQSREDVSKALHYAAMKAGVVGNDASAHLLYNLVSRNRFSKNNVLTHLTKDEGAFLDDYGSSSAQYPEFYKEIARGVFSGMKPIVGALIEVFENEKKNIICTCDSDCAPGEFMNAH